MVDDLHDDNAPPVKAWGFECKGRVTSRTAAEEENNILSNTSPHQRIPASQVVSQVRDIGERFQVMQHAYVYNLDVVVLAIADNQANLIRSSIIDFPEELRNDFGEVLKDIKNLALGWAYPEELATPTMRNTLVIQVPDEVKEVADSIKTINGNESLQGTFNVWLALSRLPKPFPSFRRLIPAVCAYWNAVKGGSDTTTSLMDNNNVKIPHSWKNTETAAVTRLTLLLFVLMHRLFQTFTASKDLQHYYNLLHYRNAANQRFSFHRSILVIHKSLKMKLSNLETNLQNRR